jgi:hypothetical protein
MPVMTPQARLSWESLSGEAEGLAADWTAAQAAVAPLLADLAALFGALDERLAAMQAGGGAGCGRARRLALLEAAEISWWCGDRVPPDRIGLHAAGQLAGAQADHAALARAAWVLRRLGDRPGPGDGIGHDAGPGRPRPPAAADRASALARFLGRPAAAEGPAIGRLAAALGAAGGLHPILQAALACQIWLPAGTPPAADPVRAGEAAVLAARLAALHCRGGASFLPLALGRGALWDGPPRPPRAAVWLAGGQRAVLAALRHLERLAAWEARAAARIAALPGRTPARLVAVLADEPQASAALLQRRTGTDRATVLRNLARLADLGLVREITGQQRYRIWTALL